MKLLDGGSFRRSGQQGRVTVLDFWASWCVPCVQAMPQVARVVAEFQKHGIQLIAVNLLEPADTVQATLKRRGIETTVALDIDGAVAKKYSTTAIPQTVIVDSSGNIAYLFVGGGPQFEDHLRSALSSLVQSAEPVTGASSVPP